MRSIRDIAVHYKFLYLELRKCWGAYELKKLTNTVNDVLSIIEQYLLPALNIFFTTFTMSYEKLPTLAWICEKKKIVAAWGKRGYSKFCKT